MIPQKLLRADSGFWNTKVFGRLETAGWRYSIGVRMIPSIRKAVEAIEEDARQTIEDYPKEGEAQIAQTTYGGRRLIVRRTRLLGAEAQLWPDWPHFAFITNRTEDIVIVEGEQLGVPVGGALLQPPAHLTDETVHINHQAPVAGTGARPPRTHQRLPEQRIELAHVPERERAQERPQRRGRRHPTTKQPPHPARAQHLCVIDAVRAQHQPMRCV